MPASPIRKLAPLADAAKSRGTKVYHLNIGQPDIETPACMRDRLKLLDDKVLEYSPSTGTPDFLRSLQLYYERRLGIPLTTNQILATTGGCEDFVIVVDSLSKRYSACGIRLGSLVTRSAEIYDASLRMAQGRLSPPGLAQFIAVGADSLGDEYTRDVVAEYQRRRDVLFDGLKSIDGVFLEKPEGAFYCMAQLPVDDADAFAAWLLTDFAHDGATVMVAPGSGFYASERGRSEVRIAYVLKEEDLRRSIELLREALARYKAEVRRQRAEVLR